MYLIYPDRTEPDAYERTLPEVFPDIAPGSFTEVPGLGWVWTSFHEYQWDLNYANPAVFRAMLGTMLDLANRGIDVLRLDAVPFLWKRMGTDCQNQPEAHLLVQAFRALTRLAAPGLALKAEAIVSPDLLAQYLGAHDRFRPECDLAYDNQLMVMLWSSLATRDVRLAEQALSRRRPAPAPTSWVTYVRCHDDIGWAVSDARRGGRGRRRLRPPAVPGRLLRRRLPRLVRPRRAVPGQPGHRRRPHLRHGRVAVRHRGGARRPATPAALTAAIRRLESMYAIAFSFGGIPLIYMGDELALRNDPGWAADPAHAHDNRWMHRPPMDWAAAARRHDQGSLEGRVFGAIAGWPGRRRSLLALRAGGSTEMLPAGNRSVLAYRRAHPRSAPFLSLTNFSDVTQSADAGILARAGLYQPVHVHSSAGPPRPVRRPDRAAALGLRLAVRQPKPQLAATWSSGTPGSASRAGSTGGRRAPGPGSRR